MFCRDVFEPLSVAVRTLVESPRIDGKYLIASNFFSVNQCHLPSIFDNRHSFRFIARLSGLRFLGSLGSGHNDVYQKVSGRALRSELTRIAEYASKILFSPKTRLSRLRGFARSGVAGFTCVSCI